MPAPTTATYGARPSGTGRGVQTGKRPEGFALSVADAARLMRLQGTLAAVVAELRSLPEGSVTTGRLSMLVRQSLDQADSAVPSPVAAELQRLIKAPTPTAETERDLRLVLGALDAWLEGLAVQLQMVVAAPGTAPPWDQATVGGGDPTKVSGG